MSEAITQAAAYDLIDRFLRNNLYDDDYEKYREALEAISQPTSSPQPAVPDDGDFFVLDDDAKAMIVSSHHYTPGNIQALIEQLTAFADPTKTTQADWDNLDWRGFCNVLQRVMMGLACDLQPAVPVVSGWSIDDHRDGSVTIETPEGRIISLHRSGGSGMESTAYSLAILALRPAVEPMTEWEIADIFERWDNTSGASMSDFVRMVEAHHGIAAKAEGGAVDAAHQPTKEAEKP